MVFGAAAGEAPHQRDQPLAVDRLGHVFGGAERPAEIAVVDDGQHDHRDVRQRRIGLHPAEHGPAVDLRHHDVERDDIGRRLAHDVERFGAVAGMEHAIASLASVALQHLVHGRIVIDHENRQSLAASRALGGFDRLRHRHMHQRLVEHVEGEDRALPRLAVDRHGAAEQGGEALGDGEAQAGAAEIAGGGGIGLGESLEQLAHLLLGHADAAVRDAEQHVAVAGRMGLARERQSDLALLGELGGVAQEVDQRLLDLGQVGAHRADVGRAVDRQVIAVLLDQRLDHDTHLVDELREIDRLEIDVHPAGFDLRQVEHAVDQAEQMLAGRLDLLQVLDARLVAAVGGVLGAGFRCSR